MQSPDQPPVHGVFLTEPKTNWRQALLISLLFVVLVGTGGWALFRYIIPHVHPRRQLVETYLYKHARQPSKLEIQSIMYGPRKQESGLTTQYVFVRFREKDAVGPKVFQEMILCIEDDQMVYHDDAAGKLLASSHTIDWSLDPNGPTSNRSP
jgi:hypothetical protein